MLAFAVQVEFRANRRRRRYRMRTDILSHATLSVYRRGQKKTACLPCGPVMTRVDTISRPLWTFPMCWRFMKELSSAIFYSHLYFYNDKAAPPSYSPVMVICTSEADASERGLIWQRNGFTYLRLTPSAIIRFVQPAGLWRRTTQFPTYMSPQEGHPR